MSFVQKILTRCELYSEKEDTISEFYSEVEDTHKVWVLFIGKHWHLFFFRLLTMCALYSLEDTHKV